MFVRKISDVGRFAPSAPTINVHSGGLQDFAWHPFDQTLIATVTNRVTNRTTQKELPSFLSFFMQTL